jgi:hypothetical protein
MESNQTTISEPTQEETERERVGGHSGVLCVVASSTFYLLQESTAKTSPPTFDLMLKRLYNVVWPWSSSAFCCVATTTFYPGRQRHCGGRRNPPAAGVSGEAACWVAGPVGWRPWSSYSWPGRPPLCTASWGKRYC